MFFDYSLNDDGISTVRFESSEGKLIDLENANFLNHRLFFNPLSCTDRQFISACEKLFANLNIGGKKLKLKLKTLQNILSNLVSAHQKGKVVIYSRAKNYYAGNSLTDRSHFTYDLVLSVIEKLIQHGYVENVRGFYDHQTHTGKTSRIWPTHKLIHFLNEFELDSVKDEDLVNTTSIDGNLYTVIQPMFRQCDLTNVLIVQNKEEGRYLPSPNKYVNDSINDLKKYNEYMDKQSIWLPYDTMESSITCVPKYIDGNMAYMHNGLANSNTNDVLFNPIQDSNTHNLLNTIQDTATTITSTKSRISFIYKTLDTSCYRVFNNAKLTLGGRFYGPSYQLESQKSRSRILINGSESVEIDYSAYHIGMLYNLENMSVSFHPYDLFGGNSLLKNSVKLMFNILLNSETRVQTIKAFNWILSKNYLNPVKLKGMRDIKSEMECKGIKANDILQKIELYHKSVSKYFYTGYGRYLQRMDSDIANKIMMNLISQIIPCLVIHDSFVVPKNYADELECNMHDEYKKIFKFDCRLTRK